MSALIIAMIWIGFAVALRKYDERKRKEAIRKERRRRYEQAKKYDFDILSCEDTEYYGLRKSA